MSTQAIFAGFIPQQLDLPRFESLTDKYAPHGLSDFIGLDKHRDFLEDFIDNGLTKGGLVFNGPPGIGKTSMGFALAELTRAELHHIPAQGCNIDSLARVRYQCNYVPMAGKRRHIVLVDEADAMSAAAQLCLLSELDGTDRTPLTTFVFTCNDTERFEPRFLDRNHILAFSKEGLAKRIADRLEYVWDVETDIATPKPNFARITKDSLNSIRGALTALDYELRGHRRRALKAGTCVQ